MSRRRNILLSFVGISNYTPCKYALFNKEGKKVNYIQEDLLSRFCSNWEKDDVVLIFTTKEAKEKHWDNLKAKLKILNSKVQIEPIDIPRGINEKEIWKIFEIIYQNLKNKDKVILDITYSFRSLPTLLISLLGYAKLMKSIQVKGIYYGAFEAKKENTDVAPIFDLTAFSDLIDWTNATTSFVKHGTSKGIEELIANMEIEEKSNLSKFSEKVKEFTENILFIRGNNIIKNSYNEIRETIAQVREKEIKIKAINDLINLIDTEISKYKSNELKNGFIAIKWCLKHDLYQQAITILTETSSMYICREIGEKDSSYCPYIIGDALNILNTKKTEEQWNKEAKDNKEIIEDLLRYFKDNSNVKKNMNKLKKIRNDINHAGFIKWNKTPHEISDIKEKTEKIYNNLESLFLKNHTD